jgi:hypothetical protein
LRPRDREIDDRPALLNRLDSFEGSENHLSLDMGTERRTKVMAHWPGNENRARSFDGGSHVFGDRDRDGRNSAFLDLSLNQSDRLMTNWSGRSEQGNVRPLFFIDCAGNALGDRSLEPLRIHVVTDKAEELSCEPANDSFSR